MPSDAGDASWRVGDRTEGELIARIRTHLPPPPPWMVVGIGDDAAVVEPERNRVEVLSVDALVEGIHFDRAFTPARAIGHRALAANLSDLAAMGAAPRLALLSFALPADLPLHDFDAIVSGIATLAAEHGLHIAGGNLTRSPGPLVIDITVIGSVKRRQALTRSGARAGDEIYVSGTIGGAAAGLQMLQASGFNTKDTKARTDLEEGFSSVSLVSFVSEHCIDRYLHPTPRIRMGLLLSRNRAARACMDLSDGLADAVRQIAETSRVGAIIDAAALPIDASARRWFEARGADAIDAAIAGGDDYELLIGVRPQLRRRLKATRDAGAALTCIGTFTADRALIIRRAEGDTPLPRGYSHFR
ncbi:MAG TPA: thiamine-phosphate kinase [Vicinamibacterales bacterium]|jgi:thiamine-monophosphate kinase|nr:thiamine-phosphate kinase [Vicinamibacterales bacterium]